MTWWKHMLCVVGFAASLALGSAALGQSGPESQPATVDLSLEDATQRTLATYEKLKISESDVAEAKGNEWQSYNLALPNIQGSYQYTRNITKPSIFFETGRVPVGFDNEHDFQINVTQPLTHFGGIYHGIKSARLAHKSSESNYRQTVADVIFTARQAYFDTLLKRAQVMVARLTRDDAKEILRREAARYKVGEIPEFDYNRAQLDLENQEANLIQAEGNYDIAQRTLRRVVGLPSGQEFRLTDTLETFAGPIREEKALRQFHESNPRIDALRKTAESAEQARKQARADFFPYLNFFTQYQSVGQSSLHFFPDSQEFFNALAVGLNVQIPLFDGMLTVGRYKSAEARSYRAAWDKLLNEKDLQLSLEQALSEARTRLARKENDKDGLKIAETLFHQAELRQQNGLISFIDLKDVQNQLELARLRYLNSLYNYIISRAQVEAIVGTSLYNDAAEAPETMPIPAAGPPPKETR